MVGEQTRRALAAQPEWLAQVPAGRRFPAGARLLFTGCGTSFHAACTGGDAVQALELVLRPDRDADLLVLVSHEGETALTLEGFLVPGAGRDLPTAHEAVLKLREGAWVAAEAYETEQLLHGFLAAVDDSVRAFVLEGEGVAAERAEAAAAALRALGCETDRIPTRHPVVDIVVFQRLTLELAESRGRE